MLNLEWLRTFRTVYKAQSLTKASKILMISQPAVSQHIAALESQTGKKLFERKSKGVIPTDYARSLNNMVASSIEELTKTEELINNRTIKEDALISIGISEHLYHSILKDVLPLLEGKIHIEFGTADKLIRSTEEGNLDYSIIPGVSHNFDTYCQSFHIQKLILVCTPEIELGELEELFDTDRKKAERWLSGQKWYSHRTITPYIKQFWMKSFDKKRPEIVPYRVIPNEREVLSQLSAGSGFALCFDNTANPFLEKGNLKKSQIFSNIRRDISLLINRKKTGTIFSKKLLSLLKDKSGT